MNPMANADETKKEAQPGSPGPIGALALAPLPLRWSRRTASGG